MRRRTISTLDAINREFYERHADRFDATRRDPWDGWERVVDHLRDLERPSILDVGCGNARFGLFAERRLERHVDYLGIDRSRPLLDRGRHRGRADWRWLEVDLVAGGMPDELGDEWFDLVVCFGVMHHLPSAALRSELLRSMSRHVGPAGMLAVSFWQLGDHERFKRRALEPRVVDLADDLEEGDYLLPWGDAAETLGPRLRYCHHVSAAEADRLLESLPLEPVASFLADGSTSDLNLYRLLRRPPLGAS